MNDKKISVIGAGKWGEAIYLAISKNYNCVITSRKKRNIKNFVSLNEALNSEYIIIAISTQHLSEWFHLNFTYSGQKIIIASKGIDYVNLKFIHQICSEYIPSHNLGFLSGPSFAKEVKQSLPGALVINSSSYSLYEDFKIFFPSFLKVYYSSDVIGAEIAGAYKNVLAIGSGICMGLNLGYNAQASLISRGLVEMARFGKFFGAKDETFLGLSGAGDLFLSASSDMSRNYMVGIGLSNGKKLDIILNELGEVAEGIKTTYAINSLAKKNNIYTPLALEIQNILDGKDPRDSLQDLLNS